MTEITTKIIIAMLDQLPLSLQAIAERVRENKVTNKRKCEERCKYNLEDLEADGIVEKFKSGSRNLYKLTENVEVMNGKLILYDKDGSPKYEEKAMNVLRMVDEEGNTLLSMLQ